MLPAERWKSFSESIFSTYTREASRLGAVNLAQGFPNFAGPDVLIRCMEEGLKTSSNQYAPTRGDPELRALLAQSAQEKLGIEARAEDFLVTAGATEAVFSLVIGSVNPGERVLVFEPFYESYRQSVSAAGGIFVSIKILPPTGQMRHHSNRSTMAGPQSIEDEAARWEVDWRDFEAATSLPFRMIILNSPHNPTGLVFNHESLQRVLEAARRFNALVVADEVYEDLVFDGTAFVSILEVAKPTDHVCRVSSVAKSFGFTGFKLGWIQGSAKLLSAAVATHEAIMFCVASHIQRGFSLFLKDERKTEREEYLKFQRAVYEQRLALLEQGLVAAGFKLGRRVEGGYFICACAEHFRQKGETDSLFAGRMMAEARVAALPLSAFCVPLHEALRPHPLHFQTWLRFAFCKSDAIIAQAVENLSKLRNS